MIPQEQFLRYLFISGMASMWNPWHGCHKLSEGCANCYVYRGDERRGLDASQVYKTQSFDVPVRRKRGGEYKIAPGSLVYTCFSSDFFLPEADGWRPEAWDMMRERSDLNFFMITKRIDRLAECVPADWRDGWDNVSICCTVENQRMADYRLPIYRAAPVKHKFIACEPLLGPLDLRLWLDDPAMEQVVAGGESGPEARECRYEWILDIRQQCMDNNVSFWFKQTGARFVSDGVLYSINRRLQHSQARKAGIGYDRKTPGHNK